MQIYYMRSRLSASIGDCIDLNARFFKNGEPTDPYALRVIRIYKCSVTDENLVLEIQLPDPDEQDRDLTSQYIYDNYIERCGNIKDEEGLCGTDLVPQYTPGCFIHTLKLCDEIFNSGVYYDVWGFIGDIGNLVDDCDTCDSNATNVTNVDLDDESNWKFLCNKFFVSESSWFVDDGLRNIRLGFEPLDSRFNQPEIRTLEIGMTPLPLYSSDKKLMDSIIPSINATITVQTAHCEIIIDSEDMSVGLRQGSYRSNPYTLQYLLDTNRFLKGTYKYRIDVNLPNGETRSSPYFKLAIR